MRKLNKLLTVTALVGMAVFSFTSCNNDDDEPAIQEGIESAELSFTEVIGDDRLYPHSDHFDGLGNATEGETHTIVFNSEGVATSGVPLHLDPAGIFKVQLKAWDFTGKEVQNDFINDKSTADGYKAFLVGGDLILNMDTDDQTGAIFQPRELEYMDGTTVNGQFETTVS